MPITLVSITRLPKEYPEEYRNVLTSSAVELEAKITEVLFWDNRRFGALVLPNKSR